MKKHKLASAELGYVLYANIEAQYSKEASEIMRNILHTVWGKLGTVEYEVRWEIKQGYYEET